MENVLKKLFDYQRFEGNSRLANMLADTESKYSALSDDELDFVCAAGEKAPDSRKKEKPKNE